MDTIGKGTETGMSKAYEFGKPIRFVIIYWDY